MAHQPEWCHPPMNALAVLPEGTVLLSTASGGSIGGLSFSPGDVLAFDPATGSASIFLALGDHASAEPGVDALALVPRPACGDGRDNDGDGGIDHPVDPECEALEAASETIWCSDGTDSDGDGVCDLADVCPGGDDTVDTDADGTPDACDPTPLPEPGSLLMAVVALGALAALACRRRAASRS